MKKNIGTRYCGNCSEFVKIRPRSEHGYCKKLPNDCCQVTDSDPCRALGMTGFPLENRQPESLGRKTSGGPSSS
jgi:hypothetical protein